MNIMPILKTNILGSTIEINYQTGEKEKLGKLIDSYKKRLSEFKYLQGKVTDNKILFLAGLKAEDSNLEILEKMSNIDKKNQSKISTLDDLDNKVKEVVLLKNNIAKLEEKNKELNFNEEEAIVEISKLNKKLEVVIKNIVKKNNIDD
mgnify:CR=1 FL=1|tara:strand:+ start:241 stop:684 length:444 start_codon:yes stop_codon:yes gene_type:complete